MEFPPQLIWFLIGFVFIISELFIPGILFVFFGVGAWITALTTWGNVTPSFVVQNFVFISSSVILLVALRKRMKAIFVGNTSNGEIEDEYTGKEVLALTEISQQKGKVEIKGTAWNARSHDIIDAHSLVIVERREGLTLHVRPR